MLLGNRRNFLRLAGGSAIAAAYPGLIERAFAIAPDRRTGTLADIDHIVVHMQENRAFDHYFGAMRGVRGLGDPRPLRLPGGRTVWAQPSDAHPDGYVLPYHGDTKTTRAFYVDGADQSHQENMHIFHRGRYDRWGHTHELKHRMLHYQAQDLPFYHALAEAFTICDAYHCSTMTQTYPNRLHLFTGCNGGGTVGGDPSMSNYGESDTPSADMREDRPLIDGYYHWSTYAERLQAAGIDWKVYQEYDNFGDNLLSVFPNFRPCHPSSELYRRGRAWVSEDKAGADRTRSDGEQLVAAFRNDIAQGRLPQISYVVTADALSEHPRSEPSTGEHVTAGLINALVDHPEVFARTLFILNYDEAGGFFDHMPPPVPPVGSYRGHSTVSLEGETKDYRGQEVPDPAEHPIGLGIRVPAMVISPWSRGGKVCSQLFDHTSVIQLMEKRFGVHEPNISTWRRTVCGDLTATLDLARPDQSATALDFAITGDFKERNRRSNEATPFGIPEKQMPGEQERGQRRHCALPYRFAMAARIADAKALQIDLRNTGPVGVTFTVHDNLDVQEPWHFTIGAGHNHSATDWGIDNAYDLTVRGPNGYWRRLAGNLTIDAAGPDVELIEQPENGAIALAFHNRSNTALTFVAAMDSAYPVTGERVRQVSLAPGQTTNLSLALDASDNWYDVSVRCEEHHAGFLRRFAGKVETGRTGKTDPGIGMMRLMD